MKTENGRCSQLRQPHHPELTHPFRWTKESGNTYQLVSQGDEACFAKYRKKLKPVASSYRTLRRRRRCRMEPKCSSSSKRFISPRTSADGGRKNRLFAFRQEATRQDLSIVGTLMAKKQHMRSLQAHSRAVKVDPKLPSQVHIPYGWTDAIRHVGPPFDCRSFVAGLLAGRTSGNRGQKNTYSGACARAKRSFVV